MRYKQWLQEILQQFFFVALTTRAVAAVMAPRRGVYSCALGSLVGFNMLSIANVFCVLVQNSKAFPSFANKEKGNLIIRNPKGS